MLLTTSMNSKVVHILDERVGMPLPTCQMKRGYPLVHSLDETGVPTYPLIG